MPVSRRGSAVVFAGSDMNVEAFSTFSRQRGSPVNSTGAGCSTM